MSCVWEVDAKLSHTRFEGPPSPPGEDKLRSECHRDGIDSSKQNSFSVYCMYLNKSKNGSSFDANRPFIFTYHTRRTLSARFLDALCCISFIRSPTRFSNGETLFVPTVAFPRAYNMYDSMSYPIFLLLLFSVRIALVFCKFQVAESEKAKMAGSCDNQQTFSIAFV